MKHAEHMPKTMPKTMKKSGGMKKTSAGGWPTHFTYPGGFHEKRGK